MKVEGGSTPHALLGLLSIRPMSGYDIRQMVQQSIGHFWSESYGQIYPGLRRLASAGLVLKKTEQKPGKPDRNVYSLTPLGRRHLQQWLGLPPASEPNRNEMLLKLFFGVQVAPSISREHVLACMTSSKQAFKLYSAIKKQLEREEKDDPQLPYWLMTLNFGRHQASATVRWCKDTLKELEKLEQAA